MGNTSGDNSEHAEDSCSSMLDFHSIADVNPYTIHAINNDDSDEQDFSSGETSSEEEPLETEVSPADSCGNYEVRCTGDIELGEDNKKDTQVHTRKWTALEKFKSFYSICLLVFALVVVMTALFSKQTIATGENNIHPVVAFVIFWFLVCWLAMMEGGQGALVGLQPIEKSKYSASHPRAFLNTTLAHTGNNMGRFIVGRQFLVVLVLFVTNSMVTSVEGASVLGFPDFLNEIFLANGLAVVVVAIMIGQLTAQVVSAECMLDFVDNYFMLFTTYISLSIEASGLMHSVYLIQIVFSKLTGTPIGSKEPRRGSVQSSLFWCKILVSLAVLGFSFGVTLSALFEGKTAMWEGVPTIVSVLIFFVLMFFVGVMEGMQIALFAVINLPEEDLVDQKMAKRVCDLTFFGDNLQAFLIGRQICVTLCTFIVARITAINVDTDGNDSDNIFHVNDTIQGFFNTGLLGAIITTLVASLAWRIIAASYPVAFLSNPLVYVIARLCLMLAASGICSAAWLLALVPKCLFGYRPDEVYTGPSLEHPADKQSIEVTLKEKTIE